MPSDDNIFRPPQAPCGLSEDTEATGRPFVSIESFGTVAGVLGLFGGIVGLVGGIAATILADRYQSFLLPASAGPAIPYGAQWVFYTLPVCTLLGIVMGCGIAAVCAGRAKQGLFAVMALSLLAAGFNQWLWRSQIADFGRNEAEVPVYYPPLMLSLIALNICLWLGSEIFVSQRSLARKA